MTPKQDILEIVRANNPFPAVDRLTIKTMRISKLLRYEHSKSENGEAHELIGESGRLLNYMPAPGEIEFDLDEVLRRIKVTNSVAEDFVSEMRENAFSLPDGGQRNAYAVDCWYVIEGWNSARALLSAEWDTFTALAEQCQEAQKGFAKRLSDILQNLFFLFEVGHAHNAFADYFPDTRTVEQLYNSTEKTAPEDGGHAEEAIPSFVTKYQKSIYEVLKIYFDPQDQQLLWGRIQGKEDGNLKLTFKEAGNKLVDALKQCYEEQLIVGCQKVELENWIARNFQFKDGKTGKIKEYTPKYLNNIISSNAGCQSPILKIVPDNSQFRVEPVKRTKKNQTFFRGL